MDFLKKGQEMMSGNNQNQQQQVQGGAAPSAGAVGNNQNEDYGDKGTYFSSLSVCGCKFGDNVPMRLLQDLISSRRRLDM
jgi:hypothetical protein